MSIDFASRTVRHAVARLCVPRLCVLLIAGCAALDTAPPDASVPGAPPAGVKGVDPTPRAAAPATSAVAPASSAQASLSTSAQASAPIAKGGAKAASSPAAAPPAGKVTNTPPTLARPSAAPPLDIASLEKRLRETNAIGVVTKITLKNQVDDLLEQFRAFYQGRLKTTLSALRQPYERLLLKVLALLQDSDPQLANAISASREAIWGILSDPVKFAAI